MKKYRLKRWVRVTLYSLFAVYMCVAIIQFFTVRTIHSTPVGSYTCIGKFIKVCGGSKEVADYLGA